MIPEFFCEVGSDMGSKKYRNRQRDIISEKDRKKTLHDFAKTDSLLPAGKIVCKFPKMNKLSKAIIEIAQPMFDRTRTFEEQQQLLGLATIAWNLSLAPVDSVIDTTNDFLTTFAKDDPSMAAGLIEMLSFMIANKIDFYPDDNRVVLKYQCVMINGDLDFQVASTVPGATPDDPENYKDFEEL